MVAYQNGHNGAPVKFHVVAQLSTEHACVITLLHQMVAPFVLVLWLKQSLNVLWSVLVYL